MNADRLVWVDLEMTGLDPADCAIVEIATLVTDGALEILAEGPELVIHQPEEAACTPLPALSLAVTISSTSPGSPSLASHSSRPRLSLLPVGSSHAWPDDRADTLVRALHADPRLVVVDVSTVKELARRWYPGTVAPKKQELHRAMGDIKESIEELKFYRANLFR